MSMRQLVVPGLVALLAPVGARAQVSVLNSPAPRASGFFGSAVAGVPDANGDGKGDVVVGANGEGPAGTMEGRAYLFSGANGALLRVFVSPHPEPDGEFGECVDGVPDVNGDGRGDVVVGAPEEDPDAAPNDAGRVYVFSGATGALLLELRSPTQQVDGEFGGAVAGLTDVNGDGFGDIAVGAPDTNPGTSPDNCGRVYVFSGRTGVLLRVLGPPAPETNGRFGSAVAAVPDANGDGRGDLIIGARFENVPGGPVDAGRAHLYSGASGFRLRGFVSPGLEAGGRFGHAVAGIPDVNGDGRGDVVIGAPRENPGTSPQDCGRAYVYSGASGVLLWKLLPPLPEVSGQFGVSVAGLPDVNGDGRGDVAVGAWNEDPGTSPADAGRVHVYSGATGVRLFTLKSPSETAGGVFGVAVAGVRDTNGNGRGEIVVGAMGEGALAAAGRAYLFRR